MEKREDTRPQNGLSASKVVQSGKVYRQKFDAEVQLVRALTENEMKRKTREPTGVSKELSIIPLVRETKTLTGPGMLTGRQRTWIEGFPNESHQENPVMIKYYTEASQMEASGRGEEDVALSEVQGLPDVVSPMKTGSNIIERIAESRKQRHEAAVEDMHQELGVLSSELEPKIISNGESLITRLGENDSVIEELMKKFETDEQLMEFTRKGLDELWGEIAAQSQLRRSWISDLDTTLQQVETERLTEVRQIFITYSQQLEKISHLMQPNLQRLLDHESQMINQTVLSNKRAYADLHARLMMSDIEREKKLHTQWRRRVDDWKKLHTAKTVSHFVEYMDSDPVQHPPSAALIIEEMKEHQHKLNVKRIDLIDTLLTFQPPASTKTAVYKWNQQLTEISKQIDKLNQEYFNTLCKEYEKICQTCLEKVDEIKSDLISRGVCSDRRAQHVVNEKCLPLVGQRQTTFEKELEVMDKTLESHNSEMLQQLRSLFKYCQGAAHVWDVHELGLAKTERALQEKLDECRRKHDNDNQDKEANLDIVMDRMRQDATEHTLQDSLKKALDMLSKIKQGYEQFHVDQCEIVTTYPQMVEEELLRYDGSLCKFFSISRDNPADAPKEEPRTPSPTPKAKPKAGQRKKKKGRTSRPGTGEERKESPVPTIVSEILSTAKGTTFYVLTVAGEHGPQDTAREGPQTSTAREGDDSARDDVGAFVTEVPGQAPIQSEPEPLPHYVSNVHITNDKLTNVKQRIRMNMLDQLEEWYDTAILRSNTVVAAKTEELNSELDLRHHLHEPRSRRAELDIHNVRAAELVMHSERVTRHCKGINQALNDLKQRFNQMTLEHNKLAQKYRKDIESLETIFINATKSAKLIALSNQLQVEQDNYMEIIRASLRQFRKSLDDTLQMLRDSNARFIKSFKIFSDGGNFCPEEIEEFRKKLEKMSHKIDSAEGFIMADLEGMESKRLDHAIKVSNEFEDRFKHHMIDLVFMEKVARWLTNTQVKIKAEVADSNSQAQRLAQYLSDLDRRIDACERPNLDKEQVTPTQLNDSLKGIFEGFHARSLYLNSLKEPVKTEGPEIEINGDSPSPPPPPQRIRLRSFALTTQYNVDWTKVGFTQEINPVQRASKQAPEDPSVSVIKNILKTQKSRLGIEVDTDDQKDTAPRRKANVVTTVLQVNGDDSGADASREKSKSRMSHRSDAQSLHSKKSGKSQQTSNTETPKRIQSGTNRMMFSKGKGIDKKYFIFGEYNEEGEEKHLLGRIKRILREALEGLLAASELYYRQKGSRTVTRPQALQETFEQCADVLVQKLQSYHKQSDEFHNQSLQEYRSQLDRLEDLVYRVPKLVIDEFLTNSITESRTQQDNINTEFGASLKNWNDQKSDHQTLLRPALGHPNQAEELQGLCEQETTRKQAYLAGVDEHTKHLQESAGSMGSGFVEKLAQMAQGLFLQFDALLTIDDVEKGRVPTIKHDIAELQRRKNVGRPLEDDEVKEKVPRGKKTWPGLPTNEIYNPHQVISREQLIKEKASRRTKDGKKKEAPTNTTPAIHTQKNTLGHNATLDAMNDAYQRYKSGYEASLERIEQQKQQLLVAEQRWSDSWNTAVDKVKQLY